MFVLAHLSDPHLGPLPRPNLTELAGKRLLGFVNWHLWRRACHRGDILAAIVDDLQAAAPDHIAVTGDLINIALEQEFGPARAWLDRLGSSDRVTLVPGNHDVYVRATARHAEHAWGEYMRGDGTHVMTQSPNHFPFVRRDGPIALIGLSTALPTFPLMATGALGPEQTARLAVLLPQLAGAFRVVLIHHPPLGARAWHKRLADAEPFLRVVKEHGAELVLHGHDHRHSLNWIDGRTGRVPVVGVPACSAAPGSRDDDPAAYNLYRIDGEPGAWRCELIARGLRAGDDGIVELRRQSLIG
jgi:3',5'-cyclic AMP phosphodiesterase CpdA